LRAILVIGDGVRSVEALTCQTSLVTKSATIAAQGQVMLGGELAKRESV
jgi:hypothetical protein